MNTTARLAIIPMGLSFGSFLVITYVLRVLLYAGFALIIIGFFLQCPTLVTGLMLPVLLAMYWRLAKREEREVEAQFGEAYPRYAGEVPALIPRCYRLTKGPA